MHLENTHHVQEYGKTVREEKTESNKCNRKPPPSPPADANYNSSAACVLEDMKPFQDPIGNHIQKLESQLNVIHVPTSESQNSPSIHQVCLFYTSQNH